jgi:hypothetical protein
VTSAYLPGPEHAASTSGQTGVVCAFVIQSNEIVIHVHASVASHVLGSSRGMTKGRNRRKFSKSTNFLIHQNSARVSLSLQTAVNQEELRIIDGARRDRERDPRPSRRDRSRGGIAVGAFSWTWQLTLR